MSAATMTRAAVVVETEWERPATKRRPAATVVTRTAHVDPDCSKARDGQVVARDVDLDSPAAGLPCDYCIPNLAGEVVVTQAERDWEESRPERHEGSGSGRRVPVTPDGPSEKQVAFWRSLMTDLLGTAFPGEPQRVADAIAESEAKMQSTGRWTRRFLSEAIDGAKASLDAARRTQRTSAPAPAPAGDGIETNGRENRYGGDCARCGVYVAEGSGLLGKRAGKWVAVHRDGDCSLYPQPTHDTPAAHPSSLPDVPQGHYAIRSTGDNDLAFYRVDRPTDGQYAGRVFVKLVVGGHPDQNVRRDAIHGILARIVEAGVEESGRLYGQEIGSCARCNRHLTHAVSRFTGYGPTCRGLLGISVTADERAAAVEAALRLRWDVEIDGEERD